MVGLSKIRKAFLQMALQTLQQSYLQANFFDYLVCVINAPEHPEMSVMVESLF